LITFLLRLSGWILARAPQAWVRVACVCLAELVFVFDRKRRRLILSNLDHAFPDRPLAWKKAIGRQSLRRLVETATLALAGPYMGDDRLRRCVSLGESGRAFYRELSVRPHPAVLGTVHMAYWETQSWLQLTMPEALPEFGIIYRPLDNPNADAWIKASRERHGMKLLSRRSGFSEALRILRGNGCVGILFDQNAGLGGALTLLLGRVCSTTELPGVLGSRLKAQVRGFYPRRLGFWRVQLDTDPIPHDGTTEGITIGFNRWLESLLGQEDLCASWLWGHNRWKTQDIPARRLRLESKRNLLAGELRLRDFPVLPRKTRIWVRMPNWLGDVVMALPLLRALRKGRPDAEITLVARPAFLPLLAQWAVADALEPLPARGWGYFRHFLKLRKRYPDTWILFTNSARGDLEAWLAGAPQRFGIIRPGTSRPLLTHAYVPAANFDEARVHQTRLWDDFLRHFGLELPPDFSVGEALLTRTGPVGLIPGSENTPKKRWPVRHWRALIEGAPSEHFILFGVEGDRPITAAIASGFNANRVIDLAGRTDLAEYMRRLRQCRILVSNDTGGMHLANALGVPVIGLFGPSNPVRTGPVFAAPCRILQPDGCDALGGGDLQLLAPERVLRSLSGLSPADLPRAPERN
jgi:heptosyltransferase-2